MPTYRALKRLSPASGPDILPGEELELDAERAAILLRRGAIEALPIVYRLDGDIAVITIVPPAAPRPRRRRKAPPATA